MRISLEPSSVSRLIGADTSQPETQRQLAGLGLIKALVAARKGECILPPEIDFVSHGDVDTTDAFWPIDPEPSQIRLEWPFDGGLPALGSKGTVTMTPWAFFQLEKGEFGPLPPEPLLLPRAAGLLVCDGLRETPAGFDLLRLTSCLEVLDFPTALHSHLLIASFVACGTIQLDFRLVSEMGEEVVQTLQPVGPLRPSVLFFKVLSLDQVPIEKPGLYHFELRLLDQELAKTPLEVHGASGPVATRGFMSGQQWSFDPQSAFGERG